MTIDDSLVFTESSVLSVLFFVQLFVGFHPFYVLFGYGFWDWLTRFHLGNLLSCCDV